MKTILYCILCIISSMTMHITSSMPSAVNQLSHNQNLLTQKPSEQINQKITHDKMSRFNREILKKSLLCLGSLLLSVPIMRSLYADYSKSSTQANNRFTPKDEFLYMQSITSLIASAITLGMLLNCSYDYFNEARKLFNEAKKSQT